MWLWEWPRLKKLYTIEVDSERTTKRRCFAIEKSQGAAKVICKAVRGKRCNIERRAAAKALRRLATKIRAERLRAGGQGWDQDLGLRRAAAGDVVIPGKGIAQSAAGPVGAGGDSVKVGGQARCSHRVHRSAGRAQVCFTCCDALRIGDGDERGPLRRRGAGAAYLEPTAVAADSDGVVNGVTGAGIGVVGNVRHTARSVQVIGDRKLRLGDRLIFVLAEPAAAAAPGCFAAVISGFVERQRSAADGDHVRRSRRVVHASAAIAGGREESDAGGNEVIVQTALAGKFGRRPAHGNNRGAVAHREIDAGEQVAQVIRRSFDEENLGLRRDGVRPFDIQRNFDRPVRVRGRLASAGIQLAEAAVAGGAGRQVELLAENAQVVPGVGIVVSVHERDGLAGALVGDEIKTVGMANLRRGESGGWRGAKAGTCSLVDEVMRTHETDRILSIFAHMYLQIKWLLPISRLTTDKNCTGYQQATNDVAESPSLHLNPRLLCPPGAGLGCLCLLPT